MLRRPVESAIQSSTTKKPSAVMVLRLSNIEKSPVRLPVKSEYQTWLAWFKSFAIKEWGRYDDNHIVNYDCCGLWQMKG